MDTERIEEVIVSVEEIKKSRHLNYFRLVYFVEILAALIIALIVSWIVKFGGGFGPGLGFNYHPFFMLLGMIVILGNSILGFRTLREPRRQTVKYIHATSNAVTIGCVIIALYAVLSGGGPVFYSIHSWAALVTIIVLVLQYTVGFFAYLLQAIRMPFRILLMPYHRYFGVTLLVLATGTCLAGITELAASMTGAEAYALKSPPAFILNFLGLSIIVYTFSVVYLVTRADFARKILPEEQPITSEAQTEM